MNYEVATFVCSHVFDGSRPVLLVAREQGDWMYLCGEPHDSNEEYHVIGREHLIQRDPTLTDTLNLSDQTEAERESVGGQWIRRALTPE
ncbi:hypothetical protein [Sorangium sp. So ce1099]|uniref:hypothetical protein n=1 Tax=Sorangium sp. So ce1099 TaxID=3133331 RepID=UPI003F5F5646